MTSYTVEFLTILVHHVDHADTCPMQYVVAIGDRLAERKIRSGVSESRGDYRDHQM
jgi:hypothetical protein